MISRIRFLATAILLLNLSANIFSQKVIDYVYRPPNVRFDNFPINNGYASQESTSILIDSKGFVWSGTVTGLYRFDGVRYLEYGVSRGGLEGFKGLLVTDIFEDSEGCIWIGTSEALNKLDQEKGEFKSFIPDSTRKTGVSNFIWSINEDSDGLFWILTSQDIFSFDKRTEKFTKFQVDSLSWYPQNSLFFHAEQRFTEDSLGNKWFVTNRGLYRFKKDEGTFNIIVPDQQIGELANIKKVNCVLAEKSGNLWIGTNGSGLLRWNFLTDKPEPVIIGKVDETSAPLENISTILTNGDGIVWCFGNGSFSKYDTKDSTISSYNINYKNRTVYEAPESNIWINKAFQHEDGSIWFLNNVAGLMFRFDPEREELVLYRSPAFMVYQCILDDLGSFWFACIRGNLFRLITEQIPYYSINNVDNNAHVAQIHKNNVLEDKKGQMWFLFINGTYISRNFDIASSTELEKANFLGDNKVSGRGFSDSKGNLWLVAQRGKIIKYDPGTKVLKDVTPSYPSEVGLSNIPVICEDKDGNVWLANPCYGLYSYSGDNDRPVLIMDFADIPREQNLDMMMDFMIDSKNNFWILNGESFFMIKMPEKRIVNFTNYGDGIFSSYGSNIRIQEDPYGNIWLLNCWMGLFKYNDQDSSFTKIEFGEEGPNTQYYDLLADRLGRIWIAHNSGISVYYPVNITTRLIKTPKLQFDVQSYQAKSGQIIYVNNNLFI
jgi:ligand-binding sensor domain-containing protein